MKYLSKFKELEDKFTKMVEERYADYESEAIKDLQDTLNSKNEELQELLKMIEDEYLPISEHEQIVNNALADIKNTQKEEIEELAKQFENEILSLSNEMANEKSEMQIQLENKIEDLKSEIVKLKDMLSNSTKETHKIQTKWNMINCELEKYKAENLDLNKAIEKLQHKEAESSKSYEESMFRLNKELSGKQKEINTLNSEAHKLNQKIEDQEKSNKFNVMNFEKKLKQTTTDFESKLKSTISENVKLTQRFMKLEDKLRVKSQESDDLSNECDKLHHENLELKGHYDAHLDYIKLLETKIKMFTAKRKVIVKNIMDHVSAQSKLHSC